MCTHSQLRFRVISTFAVVSVIALAVFADAPAQPAVADGPGTSFSIDVMPGPMGYEASPMIQDTLEVDVGTVFSIDVVLDAHDGEEWIVYDHGVNYTDSVLDPVNLPSNWNDAPTASAGGNLYPFVPGQYVCDPTPSNSVFYENDDDADGARVAATCYTTQSTTGSGDLIRHFFRCENAGPATLSLHEPYTYLVSTDFQELVDHRHDATVACCDDSLPDSDSDGLTECEEADLGTNPNAVDTDTDGCSDSEEVGTVNYAGGLRDPLNHWDFYDVDGDKRVNAIDIGKVRSKANLDYPPYDRGVGAHPWAPGPPDGIINAIDIGLVRASVNHYCVDPPN